MQIILYTLFLAAVFYIPFALLQILANLAHLALILRTGDGKVTVLSIGSYYMIPSAVAYIVWFVGV